MVLRVQELETWGADGGERALFQDVPHSQATSQGPLGVPGPGMGTTDPSPLPRGTLVPFLPQPSRHFPPEEAGFVGRKLCCLPGDPGT